MRVVVAQALPKDDLFHLLVGVKPYGQLIEGNQRHIPHFLKLRLVQLGVGRIAETPVSVVDRPLNETRQRGYVGKGRQVYVEGRLDLNEYNDRETNEKRYSLDVYATEFQLIGNRGDSGGEDYGGRSGGAGAGTSSGRSGNTDYGENEGSMDDVPF